MLRLISAALYVGSGKGLLVPDSSKIVEPIYPYSEWEIIEDKFDLKNNARNETIFSLGNGYIGTRGTFEEGLNAPASGVEGTYLNGFYESHLIQYPEIAYGLDRKSTRLNSSHLVISYAVFCLKKKYRQYHST